MGLSDSFYDEDSKCPKCQRKNKGSWQTKRLESLMESWHRGDFVQYAKFETIPEKERKRKYGDTIFAPFLRRTKKYFSDSPLILNGKVPVHTSCPHCDSWLEAYAKITNGKFDRIVEAEATRKEKELVILPRTARLIREEFERRLSHLQESCSHERSKWTRVRHTPGRGFGQILVCQRCEKIVETKNPKLGSLKGRLKHWKEEEHRADKALAELATKQRRARAGTI
jgi:hypothetical protein